MNQTTLKTTEVEKSLAGTEIEERIANKIAPSTMQSLSVSTSAGGLTFMNMTDVMEFAKLMAVSQGMVPKHLRNNPGACVGICIQAVEWKMSPYAVANKSYYVNDRIAYEAQLVAAVILQRAPIKGRFKGKYEGTGDNLKLTMWAELKDEPGEIVEYESPIIGKIHPKNSPLWKSDERQQLWYYTERALCRRHFPDVLLGVYAADEMLDAAPMRDVTPKPAGNLGSRLDALAADTKPAEPAKVVEMPAHDPETGEITETENTVDENVDSKPAAEAQDGQDGSDVGDDAETEELLASAREIAEKGSKAFKFWTGKRTVDEMVILNPHMKALEEFAAQFDGAK